MTKLPRPNINSKLQNLGKSMKDYAGSFWILFGNVLILIIIANIIPILSITIDEDGVNFENDSVYALIGMLLILSFFCLLFFNIFKYKQFLSNLNSVATLSQDNNLKRTYNLEFKILIYTISVIIYALIEFLLIFLVGFGYITINTNIILISTLILILLGYIMGLRNAFFHYSAVISFTIWAEFLNEKKPQNEDLNKLIKETKFMKWGRVGYLFLGFFSTILFSIGMMKTGKNIIIYFGDEYQAEN